MASIFQKLIRKEFGLQKYKKYFASIQDGLINKKIDGSDVYVDIIRTLRGRDMGTVARMHDRLNETMVYALKVNKGFGVITLLYMLSIIAILFAVEVIPVCVAAVILLTAAFIYKLYEYMVNRYCFIDAQIILVYKRALEKMLISNLGGDNENTV